MPDRSTRSTSMLPKTTSSTIPTQQPPGRRALAEQIARNVKRQAAQAQIKAPVVAIVAEGNLVVVSLVSELPDPADSSKKYTTTWFDMFRIENGKIAEHWDSALRLP